MSLLVDMDPQQLPWSFQDKTIGWQTFASDVANLKEFREAGLNPTESTLQKTISLYLKKYGDSDIPYTTGEGGEDDNYNDCLNEMFSLSAQVAEMEKDALAEKTATTQQGAKEAALLRANRRDAEVRRLSREGGRKSRRLVTTEPPALDKTLGTIATQLAKDDSTGGSLQLQTATTLLNGTLQDVTPRLKNMAFHTMEQLLLGKVGVQETPSDVDEEDSIDDL